MSEVGILEGDIFSPNRTGHECYVCEALSINENILCDKVQLQQIHRNGYAYTIVGMHVLNDGTLDYQPLRSAFKTVCSIAQPLPARTLTTVRIPYKLGQDMTSAEWDNILQIITEELVERNIPIEVWR